MSATKTQPHTARTGMNRRALTLRKNLLKGRAPSREKAFKSVVSADTRAMLKGVTYPTLPTDSDENTESHEELDDEQQAHKR